MTNGFVQTYSYTTEGILGSGHFGLVWTVDGWAVAHYHALKWLYEEGVRWLITITSRERHDEEGLNGAFIAPWREKGSGRSRGGSSVHTYLSISERQPRLIPLYNKCTR